MPKKILMIEDDPSILSKTVEFLQYQDFSVIGVADGLTGLQKAREFLPDLIISDIRMPGLDGYALLAELRKDPATATIPFIFLTAQVDKANVRHGMEAGADDYLTKPFGISDLLAAISARFERQATFSKQSEQKFETLRQALILSLPHELRTPLVGILGYADLLMEDSKSLALESMFEMASNIRKSGDRLYRLIENYLAYANIELLRTDPERIQALRTNVTPNPQLIFGQTIIKAKQAEREADLKVTSQDIPPVRIAADHLQKIVEELTDNAFKFSAPGTPVQLAARVENGYFVLRFTNEGRGMSPEQIRNIGAYQQFDRKLHEQQGSGLGLIIAKLLVELHAGELTIDSTPEVRTTVSVRLPLA